MPKHYDVRRIEDLTKSCIWKPILSELFFSPGYSFYATVCIQLLHYQKLICKCSRWLERAVWLTYLNSCGHVDKLSTHKPFSAYLRAFCRQAVSHNSQLIATVWKIVFIPNKAGSSVQARWKGKGSAICSVACGIKKRATLAWGGKSLWIQRGTSGMNRLSPQGFVGGWAKINEIELNSQVPAIWFSSNHEESGTSSTDAFSTFYRGAGGYQKYL